MGIKYNEATKDYSVSYYKRHPITRMPVRAARRGVKTKAEANRVYAELVVQVENRLHAETMPTWRDFLPRYFKACRSRELREKTLYDYSICLNKYTLELWSDRTIDTITTEEIRLLVQGVEDISVAHRSNLRKFISGVFGYAVEAGILQRNPCPQMKFKQNLKLKAVLTEEQAGLLLSKARELDWPWYPHWMLALYLGLRNGELYALKWDKVDLDTLQIKVDSSWNSKDGFKSTKTGDDRIVPINQEDLLPFLRKLKLVTGSTEFVLPRSHRWEKGEQARELRLFLKGLGLPEIRFHDLRATWATLLLSKGVPAVQVMTMAGWKNYKTMVIYLRKAGVDVRGATDALRLHDPVREVGKLLHFGPGNKV